jgi:transcription initiation factor TFIIIB Brf1 subunit/transcription initiation factor TFIIB
MTQDRNGVMIQGRRISHSVAARDWYCSCGYRVVTRWFEEEPHWRSVCANDESHSPDGFVHTKDIAYRQHTARMEEEKAKEVWAHLPEELRKELTKGEEHAD